MFQAHFFVRELCLRLRVFNQCFCKPSVRFAAVKACERVFCKLIQLARRKCFTIKAVAPYVGVEEGGKNKQSLIFTCALLPPQLQTREHPLPNSDFGIAMAVDPEEIGECQKGMIQAGVRSLQNVRRNCEGLEVCFDSTNRKKSDENGSTKRV